MSPKSQNGAPQHSLHQQQQQQITALGVPSLGAVKKPPARPKPQEDDIFASMGLAAQPRFQHAPVRSPPPSGGAASSVSSWGGMSGTVPAAPRSAPVPPVSTAFDADAWDDGDLDDLLDS